jgi:hypothetical protein
MSNICALGDSFAYLDKKEGHWLSMWADVEGHNIDHISYPGSNHVFIVNKFLYDTSALEKYDIIFYFVTDFIRGGVNRDKKDPLSIVDSIIKKIYVSDWNECKSELNTWFHSGDPDHHHLQILHASPTHLSRLQNATDEQKELYESTYGSNFDDGYKNIQDFYSSISLEWLSRANLFALETLILKCKEKNKKLILVTWPGLKIDMESFEDIQIFQLEKLYDTTGIVESKNHLIRTDHAKVLRTFTQKLTEGKIKL